ncbi:MAG: DUF4112 domain-containing protein [Polyangiaceae bacterium]|nr:DUF4112 domain-containing protein [Polyangiaceae bacterium]
MVERIEREPTHEPDRSEPNSPKIAAVHQVVEALRPVLPPWAEHLTRLLDDLVRVPGTSLGVGLDGVVGLFVPGVGDALTGTGSIALLLLALRERVPTVILGRILLNIAIDLVVGLFPVLGDVFDVLFRANRLNLALIKKYRRGSDAVPSWVDYLIVGTGILLSTLILLTPIFLGFVYATVIGVAIQQLLASV